MVLLACGCLEWDIEGINWRIFCLFSFLIYLRCCCLLFFEIEIGIVLDPFPFFIEDGITYDIVTLSAL